MPGFLRQATASQSRALGPFVDDTDFKTAETGLTIANTDIKLVVNGGASANKNSGGGTHRVNGVYGVTFDATDTATVGEMEVSVVVAGALPVFDKFFVIEEAVFDALFAASAAGYQVPIWAAANSTVNLSATTIKTATDVETDTADIQTRLGTPSDLGGGATIAANLVVIEGQTDDIGAAGAGLTAVPWNAAWDAEVQSEVEDGLVAHRLDELLNADSDIDGAAPPTVGSVFHELMSKSTGSFTYDQTTDSNEAIRDRGDAAWVTGAAAPSAADVATAVWGAATRVLTAGTNIVLAKGSGITGFNDLSAAQVNAEADAAIETYHLDHLFATTYDPASKPGAADALLNELVESDAGVSRFTANALEQGPSGTGPTAGDIADAVWDEAIAAHLSAGSTGESLNNATAAGNPWAAVIEGALTAEDILRVLAGVAAGETTIVPGAGETATVTFRNITNTGDIVVASMDGSERQSVTVTP